jgi:hypothetical protein
VSGAPEKLTALEFSVTRIWKGVGTPRRLRLLVGASDCDYKFDKDQEYLVYAVRLRKPTGWLTATICMPTKLAINSGSDLTELGEGRPVPKDVTK